MNYVKRHAEAILGEYVKQFPIVVLTGSRQCGKSTLLKHYASTKWKYLSFDTLGISENAKKDPDLFVNNLSSNTIVDEAQKVPEIFGPLKARVDNRPNEKFILSGSANFELMKSITESLAGRAGIIELHPFSVAEVESFGQPNFLRSIFERTRIKKTKVRHPDLSHSLEDYILFGGYPKIFEFKTAVEKQRWLENYRTTYIERDIRNLAQVANLDEFQRLYKMCAFQTGNLLNYSTMSNDLGISVPTCTKYVSLLETSYQVFRLRPYFVNIGKRLVKTPKIYFSDSGLASHILGYQSFEDLNLRGLFGGIFESWIVMEIIKIFSTATPKPQYHFFRTQNGAEIDLLIEWRGKILPIEIKSSMRIENRDILGFASFVEPLRDKKMDILDPIVLYRGNETLPLKNGVFAIPINQIWQ